MFSYIDKWIGVGLVYPEKRSHRLPLVASSPLPNSKPLNLSDWMWSVRYHSLRQKTEREVTQKLMFPFRMNFDPETHILAEKSAVEVWPTFTTMWCIAFGSNTYSWFSYIKQNEYRPSSLLMTRILNIHQKGPWPWPHLHLTTTVRVRLTHEQSQMWPTLACDVLMEIPTINVEQLRKVTWQVVCAARCWSWEYRYLWRKKGREALECYRGLSLRRGDAKRDKKPRR